MVEKIRSWIRQDGLLHILACAVLFLALCGFVPALVALGLTVLAGVLKEVVDGVTGMGTASLHDILCDLMGIVLGIIIHLI